MNCKIQSQASVQFVQDRSRQVVYSNGSWWLVGGTSLSSPVWGAVLTLVNEARLEAGKSTVGFIHPVIVSLDFFSTSNDQEKWFFSFSLFVEKMLTELTVPTSRSLQ